MAVAVAVITLLLVFALGGFNGPRGSPTSPAADGAGVARRAHAGRRAADQPASNAKNPAAAGSATGVALDPTLFATGACVAFSPTSGDRHRTVFIDAGHGGIDPGAVGTTESGQAIREADETLPVALKAASLLRAKGYRVVLSRIGSTTVIRPTAADLTRATGTVLSVTGAKADIAARDRCANMAKATVLVGIYFDAGASPADAGSITGYDPTRPFSADNLRLADLLQKDVLTRLNSHGWDIPNDGVVNDELLGGPPLTATAADYGHLMLLGPADRGWFTTPSLMPGALIEPLFLTDPFEATIANGALGQNAIAKGIAQAVEQYFGS